MSKIFIVEDCTKCSNFIPCTSPKDFRVGCTKLGNLGSPLNLIGGCFPIDCPLNDYKDPKADVLDKIKAEIIEEDVKAMSDARWERSSGIEIALGIIDKYKAGK